MEIFHGVPASWGIGIGSIRILEDDDTQLEVSHYKIQPSQIENDWIRFKDSVSMAKADLNHVIELAPADQKSIFEAHQMMLDDPDFHNLIRMRLQQTLVCIEGVVWDLSREFSGKLLASGDSFLKQRADDIEDAYDRVLEHLQQKTRNRFDVLKAGDIVCTRHLKPSDVSILKKIGVAGLLMEEGGTTSHTAILARGYRIPAVMGLKEITKNAVEDESCIVNGQLGVVLLNPDEASMVSYLQQKQEDLDRIHRQSLLRSIPAVTTDGCQCSLFMNAGVPQEVSAALDEGASGIGLFRSEFLFLQNSPSDNEKKNLSSSLVSEDNQYKIYSQILSDMKGHPVTIRTIDVGGDKMLLEHSSLKEKNPLLGWRGIRFCLDRRDIFKTQIKALLRASIFGNLKIMFPMVTSVSEVITAKQIVNEVIEECRSQNIEIATNVPLGIMIETPSAALASDILAKHCDFFSIGTNDLIQYCMAVDRENENVAPLYDPCHPAVLRALRMVIEAAKNQKIPVSICGEIAGLPEMVFLLLGMGLRNFSMNNAALGQVKEMIIKVSLANAERTAQKVMTMENSAEISQYVNQQMTFALNI